MAKTIMEDGPRQIGMLTTGQMARINGVSERALRLYQSKGILMPQAINEDTGYRYYTLDQCVTLDTIQKLQEIGFSLDEIGEILTQGNPNNLGKQLTTRIDELKGEKERLSLAIRATRKLLRSCEIATNPPVTDQIMLEQVPAKCVVFFQIDEDMAIHGNGRSEEQHWILVSRSVKRAFTKRGLPAGLFGNMGCLIAKEDLLSGNFGVAQTLVHLAKKPKRHIDGVSVLPGGQYLTMYQAHAFDGDGSTLEYGSIRRMLDYANAKGFEIAGSYYDEILSEGPLFEYTGHDCLYKLFLPVSK